jgi:hypothetical protein
MLDQAFSSKNLLRHCRKADVPTYRMKFRQLEAVANSLSSAIETGSFVPIPFSMRRTKGFTIYSSDDYANILALRKINDTIRRLYRIKQSDRAAIVRQVSALLTESTPKAVLRLDIKSFYDNIDREHLLGSLQQNHLLSHATKKILGQFLSTAFPGLGRGVPRGACISASLGEFAMRGFDAAVRAIDGVYFYARYVDDIVIFTVKDPHALFAAVEGQLPSGMRLNKRKSTTPFKVQDCRCSVRCKCTGLCACQNKCVCKAQSMPPNRMDFLGYQFVFPSITAKPYGKGQPIVISIAKSKLNRIKTRIIKAFRDFGKTHDYGLLRDRIRFLTENHFVKTKSSGQRIKSGIYYNYRLIERNNGNNGVIAELDSFLRRAIFSTKGPFSAALRTNLSADQRNNLALLSFSSGFQHRRLAKLTSTRMHEAKECWRDE